MRIEFPSPVDGTPKASLRRTLVVVITGFPLAFALNPGSMGRWAYMLNDSEGVRLVQSAAEAASNHAILAWRSAGLAVPYDALRDLSQRARAAIGARAG